jgi:hypothetical protein
MRTLGGGSASTSSVSSVICANKPSLDFRYISAGPEVDNAVWYETNLKLNPASGLGKIGL